MIATREAVGDDQEQFRRTVETADFCASAATGRRRKPHQRLWRSPVDRRPHGAPTGRTVQFATVVSEEFKKWMKVQAAAKGKTMAALLDDMKAAYIEQHGE